jgi:hypothetical protein
MMKGIIKGLFMTMSKETKQQIKSSISKIDKALPVINQYHKTVRLKGKEREVGYLVLIKDGKILLYQCGIELDVENSKLHARAIEKWDIRENINELTKDL